jgi:hypothetical protein
MRPGAGRKKGSASLKTRQIADQAAREGKTPLEVMLSNMRYHDRLAEETERRVAEDGTTDVAEVLKLRKLAQEAAEGAAPYMHPRLSSVEMKAEIEDRRLERKPLSLEEWAERHDAELPGRPH